MAIRPNYTPIQELDFASRIPFTGWILLGVAMMLAHNASILIAVWRDGAYFDTDDAMRMVEVRDWLAGQDWYDLTVHRMGLPPDFLPLHWSRIVDVPLGALIRLFSLAVPVVTAETLVRIIFPTFLFGLLAIGLVLGAQRVGGPAAGPPALFLVVLGNMMTDQFSPGRIDHDDVQITLLCFAVVMLLDSFDRRRGWFAAVTAALVTVSLAISVADLISLAAITVCIGFSWVIRGNAARIQAAAYAVGLLISAPLLFAATVAPAHWFDPVCDAFAPAHLLALLAGSIALLGLAAWTPADRRLRLAILAATGGMVIWLIWHFYPACLRDPLATVDPLVRDVWLNHVSEAEPLGNIIRRQPLNILPYLLPPILALAGCLMAAARTREEARARWLVIAVLVATGLAGGFIQIRVQSALGVPVVIGGAALAAMLAGRITARHASMMPLLVSLAAAVPFSSNTWGTVVPGDPKREAENIAGTAATCTQARDFIGLAAIPPQRILTSLDAGPYVLVFTGHSVVAGPFHRNNAGNLASLKAFLAVPEAARDIALATGAKYLAFCPGLSEVDQMIALSPGGLAAGLKRGDTPSWLLPVPIDGPYRLFEIRDAKR